MMVTGATWAVSTFPTEERAQHRRHCGMGWHVNFPKKDGPHLSQSQCQYCGFLPLSHIKVAQCQQKAH